MSFKIMTKSLLFPLTLIVLSSCSYPSSREARQACFKWEREQKEELKDQENF